MNQPEPKPYVIGGNGGDAKKFCPFTALPIPGPLAKITLFRPPCDPDHCKLGITESGECSIRHMAAKLAQLYVLLDLMLPQKNQGGGPKTP